MSFVHIFAGEAEHAREKLRELPAFKQFSAAVRDRCYVQPVVTSLNEVGSYRMFGTT